MKKDKKGGSDVDMGLASRQKFKAGEGVETHEKTQKPKKLNMGSIAAK